MRKFTLLTSVLLTAPFAVGNVSAQCVATQDCASLGYSETSCQNGGIKCPFGNYWVCPNKNINNPDCTYGSYYYSDGTCSKSYTTAKKVIGVVVYDENNEKWIMALENARVAVKWSEEYVDIPEITNYTIERTAVSDLKSCENTEAMLALGETKYPAAAEAKNYVPTGAENTKGKWCLPSAGIWNMVDIHFTEINAAISQANGTDLTASAYYWSSSEYTSNHAWCWLSSGGFYWYVKTYPYTTDKNVRPVMKIE